MVESKYDREAIARLEDLASSVEWEMPEDEWWMRENAVKDKDSITVTHVATFRHLHAIRRDIQNHQVLLDRPPLYQAAYEEAKKFEKKTEDEFGEPFISAAMGLFLNKYRLLLQYNQFPYNIPPDSSHFLLWYRKDISREERAVFLATNFLMNTIKENEFVIWQNARNRQSVPGQNHYHVVIPKRPNFKIFFYNR